MSRLEELIQELCPDGVEYRRLGDVATISRDGSFQKKDFAKAIKRSSPACSFDQKKN